MKAELILIVEDEQIIIDFLTASLSQYYEIISKTHGMEAIETIKVQKPNLVLLDLGLPDIDGLSVLKEIRKFSDVPIIIVSARHMETEKVQAFDAGADDYVTKPFGNNELLARIRRTLRSRNNYISEFKLQDLYINFQKRIITRGGKRIKLTPIEFDIVEYLSKNAGKVLLHDQIIHQIWGYGGDKQILRVNMANIRRKLEVNSADPVYILTEVGVGYRMADEGDFKH